MTAILTEPFRGRTWRETAWALVAFPIGLAWFCVLVALVATGAGLAVTVVGIPILALTLVLAPWGARQERSLARRLLRAHVDEPPAEPADESEAWRRVLHLLLSERRWRSALYLLLLFPLGLLEFVVAVTVWAVAIGGLSSPILLPLTDDPWWEVAAAVLGGTAALLAAPWLVRLCVRMHLGLMRALIGPTRRELTRAAERAGSERDQAVATATRDRRAIERDLHDGAQARLVALGVELDRARHRLEDGGSTEEALELVRSAQEQARTALGEIRDLARGVHPAILTNRGLDAALSALAARSAVPVTLASDLHDRAPADVEAAAYFVASEAIANANRHADATAIHVGARVDRDRLVLEIADDGRGGADELLGTGISGLRERVGALGGTLDLTSVAGAGTTIVARLPCAS